jgi:predicted secreted hydrolase
MFALSNIQSQDSRRMAVSSAATKTKRNDRADRQGPRRDQERPEVYIANAIVTGNSKRFHHKFDKKEARCHWDI